MFSEKMNRKLNEQIQKELYSAYFYLAMKAYFIEENLDGFVNFFDVQVKEERDHALKFYDFVAVNGGKVELLPIDGPKNDFQSPRDVFEKTYQHELYVTRSIYDLMDLALEERDHKTVSFLKWFVDEQAEEEATMDSVLGKLKRAGDDPQALFIIDGELAKRVYVPANAEAGA